MTEQEQRSLQTCGKGWFIVMMAKRYDLININIAADETNQIRLNAFDGLQGNRKKLLREIVEDWDSRIKYDTLSNQDCLGLAKKTLQKIYKNI